MDADVVVVGASVAGTATALGLARRGHRVLVVDRDAFPRDKPCGEGIMPHGLAELDALGIDARPLGMPFHGIRYRLGDVVAEGRFAQGPGLGIRRLRLDERLVAVLRAEPNVELRTETAAGRIRVEDDRVVVPLDATEAVARLVVGADGLRSQVRKDLGLAAEPNGPLRYGARVHVRLPSGMADPDLVEVIVAPRVEFYVTPVAPGEVNVAVLCGKDVTRELGGDLLQGMRNIAADVPRVASLLSGEAISAAKLTGPLRQQVRRIVSDRAVLVGDAAGFIDAITGEGMSLALASARIASQVIDAGLRADRLRDVDLLRYESEKHAIERDPVRLTELVLVWLRRPWLARRVIANLAKHPEAFGAMLDVTTGRRTLAQIEPRTWARLVTGM